MLKHAFKEWAVICEALGQGKQSIILRKGGIAEPEGEFGVAETRFWLYPTFVHQQDTGIQEELRPLLNEVNANRPSQGKLHLHYWAEVSGGYHLRDEVPALLISHLHSWSEETVRQRFHYRKPGLFVLLVRVHRLGKPIEVDETPAYAGCRSWVELDQELPTEGSTPVLSDEDFRIVQKQLDRLLAPTAIV